MCTIGGMVAYGDVFGETRQKFANLIKYSQSRGYDQTGVVITNIKKPDEWVHLKLNCSAEEFVASKAFQETVHHLRKGSVAIFVARAMPLPEGDSVEEQNRQPIHDQSKGLIVAHNGTISNDKEIVRQSGYKMATEIDTEVVLHVWEDLAKHHKGVGLAQEVMMNLAGGMAFAVFDQAEKSLYLMKNFKPLSVAWDEVNHLLVFNSEAINIEKSFGELRSLRKLRRWWVKPYSGIKVDCGTMDITGEPQTHVFSLETQHLTSLPKSDSEKAMVICSGGIDSATAAAVASKLHQKNSVFLAHFNYGQIAFPQESKAVHAVAEKYGMEVVQPDLTWYGKYVGSPLVTGRGIPDGEESIESTKVWVPCRNGVMLAIAAGMAESRGVGCLYSGFNLEESGVYPDNDIEALGAANLYLKYMTLNGVGRGVKMVLALERLMKTEIVKLGHHLDVPFDKTWSCDRNLEKACGKCGCCVTRRHAFIRSGIPDKQEYVNPLDEHKFIWMKKGHWQDKSRAMKEILLEVEASKNREFQLF